jgi:hypothetical protein
MRDWTLTGPKEPTVAFEHETPPVGLSRAFLVAGTADTSLGGLAVSLEIAGGALVGCFCQMASAKKTRGGGRSLSVGCPQSACTSSPAVSELQLAFNEGTGRRRRGAMTGECLSKAWVWPYPVECDILSH